MKPGEAKANEAAYPVEFALVLACLRWPQESADGEHIRRLAQQPIRWPLLLAIVHHHKVVPLVARNLEKFAPGYLPEDPAEVLRAANIENAHTCLRRIGHLLSLNQRFREQKIDFRIFKGIPLAMMAFRDPTLRDAGDIDLLVEENDLFAAGEILRAEGYVRFEPQARLTPRRLRSYIAHQKDFSYIHPTAGIVIDLHWRLFRNPWLPANANLRQVGEQRLDLSTESIPILPTPRLLLYLCVHGALDGWLRLKWLADIRALLHTMTASELATATATAVELQALAPFSAAMLLCEDLLGPLPSPLPAACLDRTDSSVARIIDFGKRCLTSNQYCPVRELIPSTQWFANEVRLYHSPRYRIDLLERSLFRPRVWTTIPLPDWLFPLYLLLSPMEWLHFHGRQALRRWAAGSGSPRKTRLPLRSLRRRRVADIALALEAACMLSFFRIALTFLPVQKLVAWMSGHEVNQASLSERRVGRTLRRVQWSIAAVVRHAPLTFVCFPQCLAAYFMLRRRHIASTLFYGVARDEHDQLRAHTWVKVGDHMVVGGEVASSFTVLTTFP